MRKLSMKNAGIPDSEAENASGRGGVSADGRGARGPPGRAAGALALARPLGDSAAPGVPAGAPRLLPCACWACTRGVPAACGLPRRTGAAGCGVGAGSTVSVGAAVLEAAEE